MTRSPRRLAVPLALLPLLACPALRGGDWPQWRGPRRDGHVPAGEAVPAALAAPLQVVWHVPVGNGLASPVVGAGKVFYLDNQQNKETVHAADAATGKELWAAPLDELHKDSQSPPGPRCTPLADGDRVYAQSCRGELQCLAAADGKIVWRTNYVKDFGAPYFGEKGKAEGASRHGYNGSPLVEGEHLIAQVGGQPGAGVVCFEKRTGKVVWKSQDDVPGYAAPVVADLLGTRQVVAFTAEGVIGLDVSDGKLLWRVPVKTSLARHVTTPLVVGDRVIVSSHQAGLIGIRVEKEVAGFKAAPAWPAKESAINFSSPVAVGDFLFGVGPAKNLVCVDARTGKQAWSKEGYFPATGAGNTHAGLIVAGPNLLMLADNGQLALIAADPGAFREVGRAQACGNTWCNPAYADGRLYLRDAKELRCLRLAP